MRASHVSYAAGEEEVARLFTGWAGELATCRKFAPTARNYAAARLMAQIGLRANEVRRLDLADVKWELGPFGKVHVRYGKGSPPCGTTPGGPAVHYERS